MRYEARKTERERERERKGTYIVTQEKEGATQRERSEIAETTREKRRDEMWWNEVGDEGKNSTRTNERGEWERVRGVKKSERERERERRTEERC